MGEIEVKLREVWGRIGRRWAEADIYEFLKRIEDEAKNTQAGETRERVCGDM